MTIQSTSADDHCKVFVGNLPFDATDESLAALFKTVGNVTEAKVIRRFRRSLGYGFVTFETGAEAIRAQTEVNKMVFSDREISVEIAKPMSEAKPGRARLVSKQPRRYAPASERDDATPSSTTLFVANLPFTVTDSSLAALFEGFKVSKARVVVTRYGRSKGYGFVEFESEAEQKNALSKLSNKTLDDRQLAIKIALDVPEAIKA